MPAWTQLAAPLNPDDPYYAWGQETGFMDLFAGMEGVADSHKWFPVILELNQGVALEEFIARTNVKRNARRIRVPEIYAHPPLGLAAASFCTAAIRKDAAEFLASDEARSSIRRLELGLPLKTPPASTAWSKKSKLRSDAEVVTAIIDDGLAFANERFRRKDGKSRVEFLWNQDGTPVAPPGGFDIGWELTRIGEAGVDGIDKLLSDADHGGIVDEDQVYRYPLRCHIDYGRDGHKPAAWRASHGAHVMDLAAGYAASDDQRKRPIIGVQLPVATTADTSGASLTPYVLQALWYILARADLLASKAPLPVVVNLSYGLMAGPHDGSSILEAAIDDLIQLREAAAKAPLRVVLPSGNGRLGQSHAELSPAPGAKNAQALNWRIQPEDLTPSFTEIWLPTADGASAVVTVKVTTPTGDTTPLPIKEGEEWVWQEGSDILCKVLYLRSGPLGRKRNVIFIAVAPTATQHATRKVAPSGVWKVELTNVGDLIDPANPIHAWIQRDDTPYGYPARGRQSYFEDDKYKRYDDTSGRLVELDNASCIKRDGTISAIATGSRAIVIAGFRRRDWKAAKYSAGGAVVPPGRGAPTPTGPDAMAVSDDSVVHRGLLATGTRTGSTVALRGTSVAAPQFTRAIADSLAAAVGGGTRQDVYDSVAVNAPTDPDVNNEVNRPAYADPALPAGERGGAGRSEFPRRKKVHRLRYEKQ